MILLAGVFCLTALIYSTAGFAGGSTYLALLVLCNTPAATTPIIALTCNLVVASLSSIRYVLAGLLRPRLLIPHMALAIPFAYVGGRLDISKWQFHWLTAVCLLLASAVLIWRYKRHSELLMTKPPPLAIALPAGAALGFVSGVVGIGGGIFLSPLLYMLKAGTPKEIASTCSLFILVNSIAGLAGQVQKFHGMGDISAYWPLPLAVFLGGLIGSQLTLRVLLLRHVALITGLILLAIALREWWALLV